MKLLRWWLPVAFAVLLLSLGLNAWLGWRLSQSQRELQLQFASVDRVEVLRTRGGLLQVSTIHSPETFQATRPHSLLGLDLGPTVTRIRVPAVFHYHIELAPEWKLRVRPDGTVIVVAPAVQPTLPVAIDTARLEKLAQGRWSLFTGPAEMEALQATITRTLAAKAASPSYIGFQREAARQTVREFVDKWLLTQAHLKHLPRRDVRVFFADEPIAALPDLAPGGVEQVQH